MPKIKVSKSGDDLRNMQTGLFGYKGHVHLQAAPCLNDALTRLDRSLPKAEQYKQIATLIDEQIHRNYRMYPCNYIAHDLLNGDNTFASHYSREEKEQFELYLESQLNKIDIANKDIPYLYGKLLLMYANPLVNQLSI